MTQVEEIDAERHLNMTFIEFLEALVRVAENLAIPNLIFDEGAFLGMELEPEQKEEYGKRPLHEKLEAFILYLVKVHLKPTEYRKHRTMLTDYKEEEDIWANDIEVGPMRLQ